MFSSLGRIFYCSIGKNEEGPGIVYAVLRLRWGFFFQDFTFWEKVLEVRSGF